ncbi:carbon-nitrogen hydrolase family protein [Paenalcaligenes niemegkensis]|uniref:carbon-nitrogen hydrolase family protein n=1 Tax=Paenalcaligenes niemegkensis TaxID=2895469 RepID=UPI001EE82622|nr:carbon-nitrogen hydrolase family protein [Paenalcaligenes niemegkensis]MCQ9616824.1 carbon-nitrogen hydrolase family protein [Paenalcaligenes niemegkensis]
MSDLRNRNSAFKIAALQMVSSTDLNANLLQAEKLIQSAVQSGAKLLALPEYFCFMGARDRDKLAHLETDGEGPVQRFLFEQATKYQIWLIGGTLPLESPDLNRIYNSSLVYGPEGQRLARYDKIHLFGFKKGDESYDESVTIRPGEAVPQVFDAPCGRVGLAVCYDLRFPELFRAMGEINLLIIPSAFTYTTGQAHWEVLLRARAIENQCYVLAPAQGGKHESGRRTWGHSMLISPWGDIIDKVPEGPGYAAGELDLNTISSVRQSLPALRHRTM